MTDVFEKAKKNVGIKAATENVKVNIRQMLIEGGINREIFADKDGGVNEM